VGVISTNILQAGCHGSASLAAGIVFLLSTIFQTKTSLSKTNNEQKEEGEAVQTESAGRQPLIEGYDILARNPKFATTAGAKAKGVAPRIWELSLMARHFHPSVRKFADSVNTQTPITYDGDPFQVC